MKKRVLSIGLCLLMLLTCVPFAAAEAASPVVAYGSVVPGNSETGLQRMIFFTWAAGYTAPTEQCSIEIVYEDYDEPDAQSRIKRHVVPASDLQTAQIPYYENGETVTRLQCYVRFDELAATQAVEIAAGSFACADGGTNPAVTLGAPSQVYYHAPFAYYSKVMQGEEPLGSMNGVGVGDKIFLQFEVPLPVSIVLDGAVKAELPAHYPAGTSFAAEGEGTHTVELQTLGLPLSAQTYTVVPQKTVYQNQLDATFDEVKGLWLLPLAAPLAFIIMPPAGIAAALAPLFSGLVIADMFEAVFRVFNLFKR